ncbi:hypothetical protein HO173_000257 [Letharia columbiana]|uniref:Probable aspartic-type endopeptidase OPSB n=1 Tax=Letharia columbiana TaxID=112416 RepID=A0A8H6G6P5_9LECA|nr:uncharacterized protein HO173_000257 [Letharia columbiana]KAF6241546.1 hypothetical protein HO173_000257 [Letharia columbiana]
MRSCFFTALAVGFLASSSAAIHLFQRDASPAVVRLGTYRKAVQDPVKRDGLRRRQTLTETLDNGETLYYANVSLGTPAQSLRLHIDTGSSDLWANVKSSEICTDRGSPCSAGGTYDANSSSTYKFVNSDFNVSYVDGSGAAGDYATDTISIGGQTLTSLQFGIGYQSTSTDGILGVGYTADEAQVNAANLKSYPNLPQAMANAGLIKSNAYSLYLDDLEANTGSIIFGGVDTDKYTGQLQTLPIQKEFDEYAEIIITLSGVSIINGGRTQNLNTDLPTAVILDSGSSLTYLPNDLTSAIYTALDVQYSQQDGAAFVSCDLASENVTLDFTFTAEESRETPNSGDNGEGSYGFSGSDENICLFGVAPSQGSTSVLGDTFLRSAYVVYDLANNEISLAQTDFNSTTSHVLEIGTGTASVPDATPVTSAIEASVSQSGGARIAGVSGTVTGGSIPTGRSGAVSSHVPYKILGGAAGLWAALALTSRRRRTPAFTRDLGTSFKPLGDVHRMKSCEQEHKLQPLRLPKVPGLSGLSVLIAHSAKTWEKVRPISEGNYYEAHQQLRVVASRYVKSSDWDSATDILYGGALALLKAGQGGSGGDLGCFLVEVLGKAEKGCGTGEKGKLLTLLRAFPPNEPTKKRFVSEMVAWSGKAGDYPNGDPELHHVAGTLFAEEGEPYDAERHLALGTKDSAEQLAKVEYEWYTQDESHTAALYAARAVFPYLLTSNLRSANKAYLIFTSRLSSSNRSLSVQEVSSTSSDMRVYPSLPLLNFLGLLLLAVQRGSSDLYKQLAKHYAPYVKEVGTWDDALAQIGEMYFGIRIPRPGNPLMDVMGSLMGFGGSPKPKPRKVDAPVPPAVD